MPDNSILKLFSIKVPISIKLPLPKIPKSKQPTTSDKNLTHEYNVYNESL